LLGLGVGKHMIVWTCMEVTYLICSTITIETDTQLIIALVFAGQCYTCPKWHLGYICVNINQGYFI